MSRRIWESRVAVVSAHLRADGYVEQHVIDKQGDDFDLILRPRDDTITRVQVLVSESIDSEVVSRGMGVAVLNITLPQGTESVEYGTFVGAPTS